MVPKIKPATADRKSAVYKIQPANSRSDKDKIRWTASLNEPQLANGARTCVSESLLSSINVLATPTPPSFTIEGTDIAKPLDFMPSSGVYRGIRVFASERGENEGSAYFGPERGVKLRPVISHTPAGQ